jgi:hypothetical protein
MDLMDVFVPDHALVRPADFAGEFRFSHDGWPGVLALRVARGRNLRGEYEDQRLDQTFTVTGRVDPVLRHQVRLVVHDFNWLPEQWFVGYLFTRGKQAFAGTTDWQGTPFGFAAWRSEERPSAPGRLTNEVVPEDFAGRYDLLHDGWAAQVELDHIEGRVLTGVYRNTDLGREVRLRGEVDEQVPHAITFRLTGDLRLSAITMTGYLFSRPKSAICGEIHVDGAPTGFMMTRV